MKFLNTEGIVVGKKPVGEADVSITLFTATYGKMYLYIKGIRKSKKRDRNAVDILSLSRFTFYKNLDKVIINSFELQDPFLGIREDYEKINIAMYMLFVLNNTLVENQRKRNLYRDSVKIFKYLEKIQEKKKKYLLICYFLNKIIDEEGIGFQVGEGNYLSIEDSNFVVYKEINSYFVSEEEKKIIEILRSKNQNEKIEIDELSSAVRVIKIFERYINYHLHINLDFKQFLGEDI